jgi:hypothetical protein
MLDTSSSEEAAGIKKIRYQLWRLSYQGKQDRVGVFNLLEYKVFLVAQPTTILGTVPPRFF